MISDLGGPWDHPLSSHCSPSERLLNTMIPCGKRSLLRLGEEFVHPQHAEGEIPADDMRHSGSASLRVLLSNGDDASEEGGIGGVEFHLPQIPQRVDVGRVFVRMGDLLHGRLGTHREERRPSPSRRESSSRDRSGELAGMGFSFVGRLARFRPAALRSLCSHCKPLLGRIGGLRRPRSVPPLGRCYALLWHW